MIKKVLLLVAVLAVVLAVALVGLFFVTFDSPEIGRRILAEASAASGVDLDAREFSLNLRRGVVLKGVRAESSYPGGKYLIELDEVVCEHQLLPLLSGTVAIERVVLVRPRVTLDQQGGDPDPGSEPLSSGGAEPSETDQPMPSEADETDVETGLDLAVSEIVMDDASIVFRDGDSVQLGIEGFDLELRDLSLAPGALTALHGLVAGGTFAMGQMSLETMVVDAIGGTIGMDRGNLTLEDVSFELPEGSFTASMALDMNSLPFSYTMSLQGDPIDVNLLAGSQAEAGAGYGPGRLEMEARGVGTDPANLKADGVIHLSAGALPGSSAFTAMEATLGRTQIVGAPYEATDIPFRVEDHRLYIERMNLASPQVALDASGVANLAGPLEFSVALKTPRADLRIKEVRDEVLDLLTDEEGFVVIPYRIAGSMDQPQVRIDSGSLTRQARRNTGRVAKEKVLEGISGLFGRRRKN